FPLDILAVLIEQRHRPRAHNAQAQYSDVDRFFHDSVRMYISGSPWRTRAPLPAGMSVTVPVSGHGISEKTFIASIIPIVWPVSTWSPTFTNGGRSGEGPR